MEITYILVSALFIMAASLVGVITVNRFFSAALEKNLPYTISFSAGVFIFTTGFLAVEALHSLGNIVYVLLLVLAGYLSSTLLTYFMPAFHHHHDDCCHGHSRSGLRILLGDGIHNIADGLILVTVFLVSPWLGFATTISIFIHELLQEISEFLILKQAGFSTKKALTYNFLISSTIFIGVFLGLALNETNVIQGVLLALSAGFFANLIFSDLLPHRHHHETKKSLFIHISLLVLGLALIALINYFFSH